MVGDGNFIIVNYGQEADPAANWQEQMLAQEQLAKKQAKLVVAWLDRVARIPY